MIASAFTGFTYPVLCLRFVAQHGSSSATPSFLKYVTSLTVLLHVADALGEELMPMYAVFDGSAAGVHVCTQATWLQRNWTG